MNERKIRVALLLESCWHRVPGGTAVAASELAAAIVRRGDIDVVGFAAAHRRPPAVAISASIEMTHLSLPRPLLYESWARFGIPLVEKSCGHPDLVHATGGAIPACRIPLVATVHDLAWRHYPGHFTKRGRRMFESWLRAAGKARRVLCPSQATANDLRIAGIPDDRILVIPLGVDLVKASVDLVESLRFRYQLDGPVILWLGVAEPRKNLARLVEAMTAVPEATLVIAGKPGWSVNLESMAAPLGGRIRLVGPVDDEEKRAWYALADVFAFPSLLEGFGLPVLEAMAQGTPVVTTSSTATAEIVGKAGILVEPDDVVSLTEAIRHLIEDTREASRLSTEGFKRAGLYSWEAVADRTVAAYQEALLG